jgi:uncharacterized membrane protein
METTNINQPAQQEDKTAAILAYITLIGYIVAIVMHGNNKTKIGSYHLKQATGLILFSIASWLALMIIAFLPFIGFLILFLSPVLWILILVLVIMGVINAANGAMKPIPVLGTLFEKWFANAFN